LAASSQTFLGVRLFIIRAKLDRRNFVPARPLDPLPGSDAGNSRLLPVHDSTKRLR
jgi:hypothetical protein